MKELIGNEARTVVLLGKAIPFGLRVQSAVFGRVVEFCKRIAEIEGKTLKSEFTDGAPLADDLEAAGGKYIDEIPWQIVDNLKVALSEALDCYPRSRSL